MMRVIFRVDPDDLEIVRYELLKETDDSFFCRDTREGRETIRQHFEKRNCYNHRAGAEGELMKRISRKIRRTERDSLTDEGRTYVAELRNRLFDLQRGRLPQTNTTCIVHGFKV